MGARPKTSRHNFPIAVNWLRRQARQAAGADAALRVLDVDPDSRIPERRAVLAPFPDAS